MALRFKGAAATTPVGDTGCRGATGCIGACVGGATPGGTICDAEIWTGVPAGCIGCTVTMPGCCGAPGCIGWGATPPAGGASTTGVGGAGGAGGGGSAASTAFRWGITVLQL